MNQVPNPIPPNRTACPSAPAPANRAILAPVRRPFLSIGEIWAQVERRRKEAEKHPNRPPCPFPR
jgi:hypothetical protein